MSPSRERITETLDWSEPPKDVSLPLQALWWLKKGQLRMGPEWERAHAICQLAEGTKPFDWVHALAHWIEADFGNADYWYRRAGEKRRNANVATEWDHIVDSLSE